MSATIVHVDFTARRIVEEQPDETAARAEAAISDVLDWCERHGVPRAMALIQANAAARTVRAGFDRVTATKRACDRALSGSNPPMTA